MTGEVVNVGDVQILGKNNFAKREFVIKVGGEYPQEIKFSILGDKKVGMAEGLSDGDHVTVSYDIRGNAFNDKWYVDLSCWRIEAAEKPEAKSPETKESSDALPF